MAATGSTLENVTGNQKRWLVFGLAFSEVLVPKLRSFVEQEVQKEYANLKTSHNIHTQNTSGRLKKWPIPLRYENINGNDELPRLSGRSYDYSKFDCRVMSHVDFAKLYLWNYMAKFNAFDEHCDESALSTLLCQMPVFSQAVQSAAGNVTQAKGAWAQFVLSDWDPSHFQQCFAEMEQLVKALGLPSADESSLLKELKDWEMKATEIVEIGFKSEKGDEFGLEDEKDKALGINNSKETLIWRSTLKNVILLKDDQKRWLVFGLALNRVLVPKLRSFVEQEVQKEYGNVQTSYSIHTQSTSGRLKKWPIPLKYENINGNDALPRLPGGRYNYSKFDFRVISHVDFAKLYVENHMAKFNSFDEHCDASAVLTLLCKVPVFSPAVQSAAVVSQARNAWVRSVFSDWDPLNFQQRFHEMEQLVKASGLPSADETDLLKELEDWRGSLVPQEIQAQGPRAEAAYQKALRDGSVQVYRGRIMLLGQERAGKTNLKKFLLGIPFDPDEESTVGVTVDPSKCKVEIDQVKNWQCTERKKLDMSDFKADIAKMIARDLKESEDKDQNTTDDMDLEQVDAEVLGQSDASPTVAPGDSDPTPNSELEIKEEIDAPRSDVPQTSMPADQDIKLRTDTNAVLQNDVMKIVVQYLQGQQSEDDTQAKHYNLSVWDFAGQHLYYASHSVFLSQRAVYVLVHNLSKDLSAQAEPCARQGTLDVVLENPTNQTNLDNLLSWLVSLHCIRPTADQPCRFFGNPERNQPYLRPPVFIVGTYADMPFEDIIEMEKCIKRSILGKAYEKHVVRPFFAVDNTRSLSEYGVQPLQKKIIEVLNKEPYMGEKVPIRWFEFEKVVEALVAKKTYHMDLDKLITVAKQECHIDDEEELSTMLNFYHDLGVIVKHGRTVVLQAQWLINLFKQLITVPPFDEVNPLYSECWQKLEDSGILRMDLVHHVFADFIQKGISKQDILDMMEHYGLIAKFSFLPADGEPEQTYFVPAQLRSSPSGLYEIKPTDCDPCPLYLYFPDGFVPHGLFAQLLARCIKWCSGCSPKTAPNLYQNGARLFIGNQVIFDLILICRKKFIKVILKRNPASAPPTTASATMASEVCAFLEHTLQDMSRELSWLQNLKYELRVACAHCLNRTDPCDKHSSVSCAHDDCLHLLPLRPKRQMICPVSFSDEPIAPDGLEQWLLVCETEVGVETTSQVVSEQRDPLWTAATLKVTLLGDEWASSAGGLSTLNRELAIHLAEQPKVDVTFLVPEGACTDVHKKAAQSNGITVVEAKERPGYDRLDWLSFPPQDLRMDVVIGHGMKLGRQGQVLRDPRSCNCKWVQVVHTAPEQLGMFKSHSGAVSKGGRKHETEVDLCKLADLVVPIGPKLAEAYSSYLRSKEDQDIFTLTPGLFREFKDLKRNANESSEFRVLLCGRGDAEDFKLKGYDIAAKAFADQQLKGEPYHLLFVGAPDGKEDEVARKLLNCGIAEEQLTVRKFVESREKMKELFCEVDLAIMPSRTEGFGLIALEALSAGLPILVSGNSGFARALKNLQLDTFCIVDSKEPKNWAKAIKAVRAKHEEQLRKMELLRKSYGEKCSWKKQCEALAEKMWSIVHAETSQPRMQEDLGTSWNVLIIIAVLIGVLAVIVYAVL